MYTLLKKLRDTEVVSKQRVVDREITVNTSMTAWYNAESEYQINAQKEVTALTEFNAQLKVVADLSSQRTIQEAYVERVRTDNIAQIADMDDQEAIIRLILADIKELSAMPGVTVSIPPHDQRIRCSIGRFCRLIYCCAVFTDVILGPCNGAQGFERPCGAADEQARLPRLRRALDRPLVCPPPDLHSRLPRNAALQLLAIGTTVAAPTPPGSRVVVTS
jgi:hypothetical protein